MTLTFFKNSSDSNFLNKSLTSLGAIENCTARDAQNVVNPVFRVATAALPTDFNYCYCDLFKRYYYTGDVLIYRNGVYDIPCSVDVLMSWKDKILAQTATVARNENLSNGYLMDDLYKAYAYEQITTKQFPNAMTADSIILMTVGG